MFFPLFFIFLFANVNAKNLPRIRPSNWAVNIINSELNNFYKISDTLYRSEQPNRKAFKELQAMGIKSVLNLRKHHNDKDEARKTKVNLYHQRLSARKMTVNDITKSLKIIKESPKPLLIHCWHGSDRTGVITAAYRMVFQFWTAKQAIDEFKNGGYGYHEWAFPNLEKLLLKLDVNKIRIDLAVPKPIRKY